MDTNLEETTKTSEQYASTIVAAEASRISLIMFSVGKYNQ